MSEKLRGYTIEQLEYELSQRRNKIANFNKVAGLLENYGVVLDPDGFYFETGQFDRSDPPSPYIETVKIKSVGNRDEVEVSMTPDAWEQFLWMVQCKEETNEH